MKTFRFILLLLLLPVMVAAFYWETSLHLSATGHTIAQLSIVIGICAMALKLVQADEIERLKQIRGTSLTHYYSYKEDISVWGYSIEMPQDVVKVNTENGYSKEAVREDALSIEHAIPIDNLDDGIRPVPKAVK